MVMTVQKKISLSALFCLFACMALGGGVGNVIYQCLPFTTEKTTKCLPIEMVHFFTIGLLTVTFTLFLLCMCCVNVCSCLKGKLRDENAVTSHQNRNESQDRERQWLLNMN